MERSSLLNELSFYRAAEYIIARLEGGYFHPFMLGDGRLGGKGASLYKTSGETYAGLDRFAGADLFYHRLPPSTDILIKKLGPSLSARWFTERSDFKSQEAMEFWRLIDLLSHKYRLPWNYKIPGEVGARINYLASRIMAAAFLDYSKRWLSPASYRYVITDPFLFLHMYYASWNGPGWFKRFASALNQATLRGSGLDELRNISYGLRASSNFVQIRKAAYPLWVASQSLN